MADVKIKLKNVYKSFGKKAVFFDTRDELYQELLKQAKSGDRIVLMGARDNSITDMGYSLLENLKWAY